MCSEEANFGGLVRNLSSQKTLKTSWRRMFENRNKPIVHVVSATCYELRGIFNQTTAQNMYNTEFNPAETRQSTQCTDQPFLDLSPPRLFLIFRHTSHAFYASLALDLILTKPIPVQTVRDSAR